MANRKTHNPIMGEAFDTDQMNDSDRVASYARELRYYRPRGFAALANEGDNLASVVDADECNGFDCERMHEWFDEVDEMLTAWAQRKTRNEYIHFGKADGQGSVGFWYSVESAIEDCDIRLDAGDGVPRGFSGMACFVTDHGNVTVQTFSRGRMCRELLSVV
jgi:hypothetical protein